MSLIVAFIGGTAFGSLNVWLALLITRRPTPASVVVRSASPVPVEPPVFSGVLSDIEDEIDTGNVIGMGLI